MRITRRRLLELTGTTLPTLAFVGWARSVGSVPARPGAQAQPGVPLLARLRDGTPLLVTPMRRGKNLVHFPGSTGEGPSVTAENGRPVRATARPGAEGTWAEVDLPAGRSDLTVVHAGSASTMHLNTGAEPPLPSAVGADGPEGASAALGGLVAGSRERLTRCPSEALAPADATALRQLIGFIASRGAPGITVDADSSPRSRQAAQVVHDSAARANIPTSSDPAPGSALVAVGGWARSAQLLDEVTSEQANRPLCTAGVYLAPWLLHSPVVIKAPVSYVPLRFSPRDDRALAYSIALANTFGWELPSTSGFDQWRRTRRETSHEPVVLHAAAQVSVMRMMPTSHDMPGMNMDGRSPGQWVANGTCVPVSRPLSS